MTYSLIAYDVQYTRVDHMDILEYWTFEPYRIRLLSTVGVVLKTILHPRVNGIFRRVVDL